MKAAFMQSGKVQVGTLPDPVPKAGEVLVRTLACGVCASDLHVLLHGQKLTEWSCAENGPFAMGLERPWCSATSTHRFPDFELRGG